MRRDPARHNDRPQRAERPSRVGQAALTPSATDRGGHDRGSTERVNDDTRLRPGEPPLADEITTKDLDRQVRAGLRSLPETLAERVGRHLVAAGLALDEDPQLALAHAAYARSLAPRLAVLREAHGVTAYAVGDFQTALAELRAVRRMTGDPSYLPIMADCERGLGRPERAIALIRDPDVKRLAPAERVELAIVESGARRDRGELQAAVVALQGPALRRQEVQEWTVRLWYAYAAALADAGRTEEAKQWFESVLGIDEDEETDAAERIDALHAPD